MRTRDFTGQAPFPPLQEKRQHLRFDKVFPVRLESILFGELDCVARNVSAGGIFVEISEPLPLGAHVRVSFLSADSSAEIVALGEVKNHYFMNYAKQGLTHSVSGMAVRFYAFENESQQILADCLDRFRVLN
jgi:PilZ domain